MISSVKWIWRNAFRASWHLNRPKAAQDGEIFVLFSFQGIFFDKELVYNIFCGAKCQLSSVGSCLCSRCRAPREGKGIFCPYLSSKTSFALLDFALSVAWAEAGGQLEELFRIFSWKGNPCHDYKRSICCINPPMGSPIPTRKDISIFKFHHIDLPHLNLSQIIFCTISITMFSPLQPQWAL